MSLFFNNNSKNLVFHFAQKKIQRFEKYFRLKNEILLASLCKVIYYFEALFKKLKASNYFSYLQIHNLHFVSEDHPLNIPRNKKLL